MDYLQLIGLGLEFLQAFLSKTKGKLPVEVTNSVQAAIAALQEHYNDQVTKANLEAQRG